MSHFLALRAERGEMGESLPYCACGVRRDGSVPWLPCCACGVRRDGSVTSLLCVWIEERWVSPFLPLRVERGEMGEFLPCCA